MCLVALFSGAQSFKKEKKQLLTEYNQSVARYDSLFGEYERLYAGFPEQRNLFSASLRSIERKEAQLDEIKAEVLKKLNQLNNLGKLVQVTKTTFDTIPVRIVNKAVGSLREDLARVVPVSHSEFTLQLDGLDRKTQLEYLRSRTVDVNNERRQLELKYQSLHGAIGRMEMVSKKLITAREQISLRTRGLQANLDILNFELEKERTAFQNNGPKGFSEAYFRVFPTVFPHDPRSVFSENTHDVMDLVEKKDDNTIVPIYDEEIAEFPGGMVALKQYLTDNLRYPETARELGIEGRCYLQFVVSARGNISNVVVKRGVPQCPECDTEAIRLVEAMPKWNPGKNGGKPVKSTFNLPVTFKLN